jgi:predicted membrane-bound spermidine synthase
MQRNHPQKIVNILSILFFVSGVAALIYQIAWQRLLFANLGSDIESITIIVSAFMLGLGIGALVGGRVADLFPARSILLFSIIEIGIGVFGLFSSKIILGAGSFLSDGSLATTALLSFLILLFPTMLMGSTLPILVSFLARRWGNVGAATGHMYSFNTLGAALGAFATGYCLFSIFTLTECIYLAVSMNLLVAVFALGYFRGRHD